MALLLLFLTTLCPAFELDQIASCQHLRNLFVVIPVITHPIEFGFGMCLFAATILLVNYYGPKGSPKTMGTMHVITTVAMLGPFLGGYIADQSGSFSGVFRAYAVAMLICLIAVILMRPPDPAARTIVNRPGDAG